jgi:hypothetical protein
MGETCAVRQSVALRTTPVYKDLLKMMHNIGEILGASSFKICGFCSPGPAAFNESRFIVILRYHDL